MNRVLLVFTVGFFVGVALTEELTSIWLYIGLAYLLLFGIGIFLWRKYKQYALFVAAVGVAVGCAVCFCTLRNADKTFEKLSPGTACTANFLVTQKPQATEKYLLLEGRIIDASEQKCNEKTYVYLHGEPDKEIFVNDVLHIQALNLFLPSENSNEGGFNYRRYLQSQGIWVLGSCNAEDVIQVKPTGFSLFGLGRWMHAALTERIEQSFSGDFRGLVKGLLLGNKRDMSDQTKKVFRHSGLAHMLAVSGLHLTMLAFLIESMLWFLPKRKRRVILIPFILLFVLVCGFTPSVVRAALMLLMLIFADLFRKQADSLTTVALAALLLGLINPLCLYDVGFQLSFAATIGIVTMAQPIKKRIPVPLSYIRDTVSVSLAAQIGVLPVIAMAFGEMPLLSVAANLLVMFLLPYVYLLSVLASVTGWHIFVWLVTLGFGYIRTVAAWISSLDFQLLFVPANSVIWCGLFLLTGGCIYFCSGRAKKRIGILWLTTALLIVSICWTWITLPPKHLEVTFLNVGQGDCALLRLPHGEKVLIDTGVEEMTETEVIPYLRRRGIYRLDAMILSHMHDDHAGGAGQILEQLAVKQVMLPDVRNESALRREIETGCMALEIPVTYLSAGETIRGGQTKMTVLSPAKGIYCEDLNESSIVLRVDHGESTFMFMGDAESSVEYRLLQKQIDCDVLKVGHHGAEAASTTAFLRQATPQYAVISVGDRNVYGHPNRKTLERLQAIGAQVLRTDELGTIRMEGTYEGLILCKKSKQH